MKGLYAITESESKNLIKNVTLALEGGIKILQYRNKMANPQQQLQEALALAALCKAFKTPFIINDDIQLAQKVKAEGVHLGRDDSSILEARALLGDKAIIGVTCYQDIETALQAEKLGANYVAFGSFFASPTKPNAPRANLDLLQQAKQQISLPTCAIGGITLDNADILISNGADMLAVISNLFSSADIADKAQLFSRKWSSF